MCVEGLNLSIGSVVLLHVDGFSRFCWLLVLFEGFSCKNFGGFVLVSCEREVNPFRHSWFLGGVEVRRLFVFGDIVRASSGYFSVIIDYNDLFFASSFGYHDL